MQSVSSAFWARLQEPTVELATILDVVTVNTTFHWTLSNQDITAPFSGSDQTYIPAPIASNLRQKETNDLSVNQAGMVAANTDSLISQLLSTEDIDFAQVNVRRVFVDTPGLGFLQIFEGEIGEQSHDRVVWSFSIRNRWQSLSREFPQYKYQDLCVWRFGSIGCGFDISTVTLTFSHATVDVGSSSRTLLLLNSGTLTQSYANDWFSFGSLVFGAGKNNGIRRTIRVHSGDLLTLSRALPYAIDSTDVFSIAPGCRKRLVADCHSKYNNVESGYAGFKWIPVLEDANQPRA